VEKTQPDSPAGRWNGRGFPVEAKSALGAIAPGILALLLRVLGII
jgi:hypothetical protein